MSEKLIHVTPENLRYFWEKIKEYYGSNNHPVAQATSLTLESGSLTGADILSSINQAIEDLKGGVPESIDTLYKLAQWVQANFTTETSFISEIEKINNKNEIYGNINGLYEAIGQDFVIHRA